MVNNLYFKYNSNLQSVWHFVFSEKINPANKLDKGWSVCDDDSNSQDDQGDDDDDDEGLFVSPSKVLTVKTAIQA